MTRNISAANETAAKASVFRPVLFAEMAFASGTVYLNTSPYDFTVDGNVYLGTGDMGRVSPIEETMDIRATSVTLSLTGVPSTYVSIALNENYLGRPAILSIGLLNEQHALTDDLTVAFKGRMDTMPIHLDRESTVSITIESRLADLFRPRIRRYNNADQQARFPGDRGCEFIEEMVEKELLWRAPPKLVQVG